MKEKQDDDFTRISIRVKKKKKAQIQKFAKSQDRSLSNWLLHIAEQEMNKKKEVKHEQTKR